MPSEPQDTTDPAERPGAKFENWPENLPREDLVRLLRGYANECRHVEQRIASAFPDQYPLGDGEVLSRDERLVVDEGPEDLAIHAVEEIEVLRDQLARLASAVGLPGAGVDDIEAAIGKLRREVERLRAEPCRFYCPNDQEPPCDWTGYDEDALIVHFLTVHHSPTPEAYEAACSALAVRDRTITRLRTELAETKRDLAVSEGVADAYKRGYERADGGEAHDLDIGGAGRSALHLGADRTGSLRQGERVAPAPASPVPPAPDEGDDRDGGAHDARFAELRALPEGWDSYGAAPVQPGVEDRARAILAALDARVYISPTSEGGIELEWRDNGLVMIEVEPDGRVSALIEDQDLVPAPASPVPPASDEARDVLQQRLHSACDRADADCDSGLGVLTTDEIRELTLPLAEAASSPKNVEVADDHE